MGNNSRQSQGASRQWVIFNPKINLLTVFCLALAVLLSGCVKQKIRNIGAKGKNIICFGDSITFGYGVSPEDAYPLVMSKMTTIPVINAGIDGDTTIEALQRIDSDVLEREPILVIVEFCGNDFLRKVPMETTLKNIGIMVDKIQNKGAMVALADVSAGMFLAEYRGAFQRLAKEKGAIFIPSLLSGIITNPSMKSDFLHPNAAGYRIVAKKIYRCVNPYLM